VRDESDFEMKRANIFFSVALIIFFSAIYDSQKARKHHDGGETLGIFNKNVFSFLRRITLIYFIDSGFISQFTTAIMLLVIPNLKLPNKTERLMH
jgi:hypothetical protein